MARFVFAGVMIALCSLAGCTCHRPGYYDPASGLIYEDVSCAPPLGYGFRERLAYSFNKLKREKLCACTSHCGPQACAPAMAQCSACGESYFPGQGPVLGGQMPGGYPTYGQMPMIPPGMTGPMLYEGVIDGSVIDGGVIDGGVIDGGTMPRPGAYDAGPPKAPPAEEPAEEASPTPAETPSSTPVEPDAVSIESASPMKQVSAPSEPPPLIITPRRSR